MNPTKSNRHLYLGRGESRAMRKFKPNQKVLVDNFSDSDLQVRVSTDKKGSILVVSLYSTKIGQVGSHTTIKDAMKGKRFVPVPLDISESD